MLPLHLAPTPDQLFALATSLLRILATLLFAWILTRLIERWFPLLRKRMVAQMVARRGGEDIELEKRAATIGGMIRRTLALIVWVLAIVMSLKEAGFDVGPLLAGAGVAGVALGFGAQHLVQDVIAGVFLLLENQIRVNDVVTLNGASGLVEAINLRTTSLRAADGAVHIFRNGAINTLTNMTHGYSFYVFDVGVAYKEDTDRVSAVLREIGDELMREEEFRNLILEPLEVLGLDRFADSSVILKARFKTAPSQQWRVGREMNRRIKKRFDELGIEIPSPHTSIYFGETSKPFLFQRQDFDPEALKRLVAEVLEERSRLSSSSAAQ